MIKTIEFHGRTVVAPIPGSMSSGRGEDRVEEEMKMVQHLDDYFVEFVRTWFSGNIAEKPLWVNEDDPAPFIEWWFEQERKILSDIVLKYFDNKCIFSKGVVDASEAHEIISRGAASNERALVPWNMVPVERTIHDLLQEQKWTVFRYDPFDVKNGLICFDAGRYRIKNEDLYFYNRPTFEASSNAHARRKKVLKWAKERIKMDWEIAPVLVQMRVDEDYKILGDRSHKSMLSGMQNDEENDKHFYVDTGLCNSLEKAIELAIDLDAIPQAIHLAPPTAVRIMKRIEDRKEMLEFLVTASYLSKMDFKKEWDELYSNGREGKEQHRDAIEAVCGCGEARLKVHRHVLEDADDQFGMNAQFTVDNGNTVHTDSSKVEIVLDIKENLVYNSDLGEE